MKPILSLLGSLLALTTSIRSTLAADPLDLGGNTRIDLVDVPVGEFMQGGDPKEAHSGADEGQRKVHVTRPYSVGRTPVTVAQFRRFVDTEGYRTEAEKGTSGGFGWDGKDLVQKPGFTWRNPGFAQTRDDPVVIVTYNDAVAFTSWVTKVTGRQVRLPTEAEWEWAVGAGARSRFFWGDDVSTVPAHAWFFANSAGGTKPVGQRPANARGILDPVGNVWQWCADYHGPIDAVAVSDPWQRDPITWPQSDKPRRVLKGGSWFTKDAWKLRTGARHRATEGSRNADFGFRVVVVPGDLRSAIPPSPSREPPTTQGQPGGGVSSWLSGLALSLGAGGGAILLAWRVLRSKSGRSRVRAAGLGVTVCRDGFLVHGLRERSIVAFRVGRGSRAERRVSVEPNRAGAFIYTGETPSEVELLDVVPHTAPAAALRASVGNSRRDEAQRQVRMARSEDRWPSAY